VDGVAATAEHTDSRSVAANPTVFFGFAGQSGVPWCLGQIILWDDYTDPAEVPYFVTRSEPTGDGTNTGTWTPSIGSDDFAVVDSPFDTATYTEEASPTAGDKMEVLTDTINTAIGITASSVQAVTAHTYSVGQTITARAVVRDGPAAGSADAEVGATETIDLTDSSYATATATTKNGGGSWSGTDAPAVVYDIVTV